MTVRGMKRNCASHENTILGIYTLMHKEHCFVHGTPGVMDLILDFIGKVMGAMHRPVLSVRGLSISHKFGMKRNCAARAFNPLKLSVLYAGITLSAAMVILPVLSMRVTAEEAATSPLASLMEAAYRDNPGIAAARMDWMAAAERVPQAEALPDPMAGFTYTPLPMEKEMGSRRLMFMASQMLPAPGRRGLMGDRSSLEAEAARLRFDISVRDTMTALKAGYAELQYLQEAASLTKRQREFVRRLADIAARDYAAGSATLLDSASAESQEVQIDYDLMVLEELRRTEVARVNSLLGRAPDTPVAAEPRSDSIAVIPPIEDIYKLIESNRQETLLDELNRRIGAVDVSLARKSGIPDVNLGVVYDTPGKFMDPEMRSTVRNTWSITFEINLPVYRRKIEAAKREAEYRLEAARLKTQRGLDSGRAGMAETYFRAKTSARLAALYRDTLVPQVDSSLEAAETLYNSGQETFSGLLEVQSAWLNFHLALARAQADFDRNFAALEQMAGTVLTAAAGGAK